MARAGAGHRTIGFACLTLHRVWAVLGDGARRNAGLPGSIRVFGPPPPRAARTRLWAGNADDLAPGYVFQAGHGLGGNRAWAGRLRPP